MKKHTKNNSRKRPEPLAVLWVHKNNVDDADARIFRAYDLLLEENDLEDSEDRKQFTGHFMIMVRRHRSNTHLVNQCSGYPASIFSCRQMVYN